MKLAACTIALATITAACVAEQPLDSDEQSYGLGAVEFGYTLHPSEFRPDFGELAPTIDVSCSHIPNGVVRGWWGRKPSSGKFSVSRVMCRNMKADGDLGILSDAIDHFDLDDGGTTGGSMIDNSSVPVGVRVRNQTDWPYKIKDFAMLYADAGEVADQDFEATVDPWAFGNLTGYDADVLCEQNRVVTGISVAIEGDDDRVKLTRVRLECAELRWGPWSSL